MGTFLTSFDTELNMGLRPTYKVLFPPGSHYRRASIHTPEERFVRSVQSGQPKQPNPARSGHFLFCQSVAERRLAA
jgi:hypothetical protein